MTNFGFNAYAFDPQGSLQAEDVNSNTFHPAANVYVYDGYGDRLSAQRVSTGSLTAFNIDPVQFGGQSGYYTDISTNEVDLTHRYYDPATGHFLNRDPIGYNGGQNLYAFCGNNPITGSDPMGTQDVGSWIDQNLLGSSISHWGTVQGQYDSGKASGGQLALAAASGVGQTVFLAVSIEAGGAGILRAGAKALATRGVVSIATEGAASAGTGEVGALLQRVRASQGTLAISKGEIAVEDLANLTEESGNEFAVYRDRATRQLFLKELGSVGGEIPENSRLLIHSQPGEGFAAVKPSGTDYRALSSLKQYSSYIIDGGKSYILRFSRSTELTGDFDVRALP